MKVILVCEAAADGELASCLVERSLRHHGPRWFDDLPQVADLCGFEGSKSDDHTLWTELDSVYRRSAGRPLHGRRSGPYSLAATKAILLAERENKLWGLILMVDLDRESERRTTLMNLRENAATQAFEILLATPNPEREAWVLHGFEPANEREKRKLQALKRSLGFDPRFEPQKLRDDARRAATRRDIKQVLDHLVDSDRERERRCWEETSLDALDARGEASHLREFLVEIRDGLLPKIVGGKERAGERTIVPRPRPGL